MRSLLGFVGGANLIVAMGYFHDGRAVNGWVSVVIAVLCFIGSIRYDGSR